MAQIAAMIKVKICGIQRLEDALVAAGAGADFVGLVFVPGRPRRVEISTAAVIVSGIKSWGDGAPRVVGLFAGQPLDEVNETIEACGLDLAQLCGSESLDYCDNTLGKVIKVVHVPNNPALSPSSGNGDSGEPDLASLAERVRSYREGGHLVTLDRLVEGIPGGTGQGFDWDVAAELARQGHSFILAGGLSPETVGRAIGQVQPWGVDVSSGVETERVKDPEKIRAFIRNARLAEVTG